MKPPSECIGRTLAEMKLRNRFGLHVLAVRAPGPEKRMGRMIGRIEIPDGNFLVQENHILIIMGENKNIERFRRLP